MQAKRPLLVWLLSIIFVAMGIRYILQVIQAIQSWNLLVAIHYHFGPLYPVFQGVLLAGCFLVGAILLISLVNWAPAFSAVIVIFAAIWSWVDRFFLSLDPLPFSEQIFSLVSTIVVLAFILGALWSVQPDMILSKQEPRKETIDSSSNEGLDEQK